MTIRIRAQNFSKSTWNRFYVMLSAPRHKPIITLNEKRDLWPLHFEKKGVIISGLFLTK